MTLNEKSPIKGVYDDFIVLKSNELISLIQVDGINIELLNSSERKRVFKSYESYLATLQDNIQNITVSKPIDIKEYVMYWKKRYIEIDDDINLNDEIKKRRKKLIADQCVFYDTKAYNLSEKIHIVAISESIQGNNFSDLKLASEKLLEKLERIEESLKESLKEFNIETKILNSKEILAVIQCFTDFSSVKWNWE